MKTIYKVTTDRRGDIFDDGYASTFEEAKRIAADLRDHFTESERKNFTTWIETYEVSDDFDDDFCGYEPTSVDEFKDPEEFFITEDDFGAELPDNWEEIADHLNWIIKSRCINSAEGVRNLWEEYWNGVRDREAEKSIYENLVSDMLGFHDPDNSDEIKDFYAYYKQFHEGLTLESFTQIYEDALRDLEREN